MVKIYKYGKDQEGMPCIELDDGTVITFLDVVRSLFKGDDGNPNITKIKQAIIRMDLLPNYENVINWANLTPAQLDTYIDTNVADLASAKTYMKKLSRAVLFLLQREIAP